MLQAFQEVKEHLEVREHPEVVVEEEVHLGLLEHPAEVVEVEEVEVQVHLELLELLELLVEVVEVEGVEVCASNEPAGVEVEVADNTQAWLQLQYELVAEL